MDYESGPTMSGLWGKFPKRRSTIGKHLEYPTSASMLVLVSNIRPNSLDVVHTGDAGADES